MVAAAPVEELVAAPAVPDGDELEVPVGADELAEEETAAAVKLFGSFPPQLAFSAALQFA